MLSIISDMDDAILARHKTIYDPGSSEVYGRYSEKMEQLEAEMCPLQLFKFSPYLYDHEWALEIREELRRLLRREPFEHEMQEAFGMVEANVILHLTTSEAAQVVASGWVMDGPPKMRFTQISDEASLGALLKVGWVPEYYPPNDYRRN